MHRLSSNDTFLSRYWLYLVLSAVVFTRVPFLWTGYGADADAWLVANSASTLRNTGTYLESRLPGYPLHEIVSALFVPSGGAPLSNAATLVATLIAVYIWNSIVQRLARHQKMLVIAFAFSPVIWQHSAVTLDYMWSLLAILLSLHAILKQRIVLAGIALGIAAGFRPANLVAVVPLLSLIIAQRMDRRQLLKLAFVTCATTTAVFLPLVIKYGITGWFTATREQMSDVHLEPVMRVAAFLYRSIYFIGPLTAAVAGYVLFVNRVVAVRSIRVRDPIILASIIGVVTFLLLFLWLPLERAYLLPALPFLLLLMDRCSPRRAFSVFTVLLVLSGLVTVDVIQVGNRRAFGVNVHEGMVFEELHNRTQMLREREAVGSYSLPEKAIVMTSDGPSFWFENPHVEPAGDSSLIHSLSYSQGHFLLTQKAGNPGLLFVAYLKQHEVALVREAGYQVYCLARAKQHVEHVTGYAIDSMSISVLEQ
ncbi:MAG: DUF2029 domain-containing protein [Bacteroidetes bacterium]|nr:DUF2029 domain-containing protein [Bacteroidota bacterium]MCW5895639.1 DUF2029 domain-containing protein [Bacteroidota bacterium]